jgi:hypothetical protein
MTSEEISALDSVRYEDVVFLKEIAFQLAVMNEREQRNFDLLNKGERIFDLTVDEDYKFYHNNR